jgi:hypothetical protein
MTSTFRPVGLTAVMCVAAGVIALAGTRDHDNLPSGLVREVRIATSAFRDLDAATAAGYVSSGACVSGPEEGAMGVHYPKPALLGDADVDSAHPELLIYEQRGGRLRLVGVEFLVFADAWNTAHPGTTPVLTGQTFNYVGSPNRYGLPAFYELHVWAWRDNPHGVFVDWNPNVSCEEYAGEGMALDEMHHH